MYLKKQKPICYFENIVFYYTLCFKVGIIIFMWLNYVDTKNCALTQDYIYLTLQIYF